MTTDIQFRQIPSNLLVPLFYFEMDNSHANTAGENVRALLIGSKLAAGSAPANIPTIIASGPDSKGLFGTGSILAQMAFTYRRNDPLGEFWGLPLADAGGAVAATGSVSFTGPATAVGVLSLYIGGLLTSIPVASGTTATALATAVIAAVNGNLDLPVTAAVDGVHNYQVNFTARNAGLTGNDIDIRLNYRGASAGEATPAGIVPTITAMSTGATNPTLTTALANLQDEPFEVIACSYTDATSIAALTAFLNDTAGRWSWLVQVFGHYVIAYRATYSGLTTFGVTQNDQHESALGVYDTPTPVWKVAAALAAQAAISVRADPALPIREIVLQDVLAPPRESRFSVSQRNALLVDGISTFKVDQAGNVILEKLVSTYQVNTFGQPDNSYRDAETLFNSAFILRQLRTLATSKYGRVKLAKDGTRLQPGSDIVTPSIVRADLIAKYRELEDGGFCQQSDVFAKGLIVQINAQNANRLDVLFDPVLIARLDIFAVLNQFRLS
ncbi:MAG: phage tail sheath subtilisin-like domain-containing protein [Pseudomonadota bacterium]